MPYDNVVVACVYWGTKYSLDYVYRLRGSVTQKLKRAHKFVCLSDRQIQGIPCVPVFANNWEGWWQKVALFNHDLFPPGYRVLFLDLDVVITDSLTKILDMEADEPIIMIENFGPNKHHAAHNSSVMSWNSQDTRLDAIYDLFTADVMKRLHGDQCWIWRVLRENIANFPPGLISSYKYDQRMKRTPPAPVVVFHGDPKPHQVPDGFVKEHWGR